MGGETGQDSALEWSASLGPSRWTLHTLATVGAQLGRYAEKLTSMVRLPKPVVPSAIACEGIVFEGPGPARVQGSTDYCSAQLAGGVTLG